jgi:hypothetical protein
MIDAESALKSNEFAKYVHRSAELENISLKSLARKEKLMFFLNIYQVTHSNSD